MTTLGGGRKSAYALERANIICNQNLLPTDRLEAVDDPSGLRFGTQEVTRLGMKEPQIREIGAFISAVLIDGKDPKEVANQVTDFRKDYNQVVYCFE